MRYILRRAFLAAAFSAQAATAPGVAAPPQGLRAGIARMDITPDVADLPAPFKTIHDHLFVRAVILDDGIARAAIVVADVPTFAPAVLADLRQRIADRIHAPVANILLATTHNHDSVRIDTNTVGNLLPGSAKITEQAVAIVLATVAKAAADLQPARAGYAGGTTTLIARRARPPGTAPVLDEALADRGPPNSALGVLRIETPAGEPLAFVINSGLEPVLGMTSPSEVGSDVAGATERYIEQRYGDRPVALYTVGPLANTPYNARRQGPQSPADPHVLIGAMSTILGEDVLAAAAWIMPMSDVRIRGAARVLQCAGKVTAPLNLPEKCSDAPGSSLPKCVFSERPGNPVDLQIGILRIGGVTLLQADANVANGIWRKVKAPRSSAFVATSYGPMHYVVEDEDYPRNTYPATATLAARGCAANGFVAAADALVRDTR